MENNYVLEQICGLRRSFEELISRHSGDSAFADSVKSAIDEAGFPSEQRLRKEFAKSADSARVFRIGIFGAVQSGKSTLLNSLFFGGKAVLPEVSTPWTTPLVEITWGDEFTVTIDSLLTDQDIAELKKKSDEHQRDAYWRSDADELYKTVKEQYYDCKNGVSESFKAGSADEIAERLHAYVCGTFRPFFRPFISKVSITLPDENLNGLSVIEIPRYDDLVPSRDEQAQFALRECDGVFVLVDGPHFFSDYDGLKAISRITKKNGLREIYSVLSMADKTLCWRSEKCRGDIDAAIDKVDEDRRGRISRELDEINQNGVFDQLISEASDRMFLTSGICASMAQSFAERENWDSEKKYVWKNLCESYPGFFSDAYLDSSVVYLERLGNTEKILGCMKDMKERMSGAFSDCMEQFESRCSDAAMEARDCILQDIKVREDEIRSNDLDSIENEIKLLQESYRSIAAKADAAFIETLNTWHNAALSDYKQVLSGPYQDITSAMQNQVGHKEESVWKKGRHFWNSDELVSITVTTVNVYGVKNAVLDCIEDYNGCVADYFNDQVCNLVSQVMESVQKVWSECADFSNDPETCFQNRIIAGIRSVIGCEYDLECKLTPFTYSNSQEWQNDIGSELKGNDADDCINKSRNFINGLKLGFEKKLHDAIEDVYNKCKSCSIAETVLRPYLRQLEDKKKAMEAPEPALENLRRMEEEVEAIDGEVVKKDCNEAFKSYRKSAEQGNAEAQLILGNMYHDGIGTEQNSSEALVWYMKSAEQGNAEAQLILGNMYHDGTGTEQNSSEALVWYMKSAEQGNAEAQFCLANLYYDSENYNQAVVWCQKSAGQGNAKAQLLLGNMYKYGKGVQQNYAEAFKWYQKSAELGNADASAKMGDADELYRLGKMYYDGQGVSQDYAEAFKWFKKSAELGNADASAKMGNADELYRLGKMYYDGQGVERDYAEAFKWFMKSAELGNAKAQYQLFLMYGYGQGVERDNGEALKWHDRAKSHKKSPYDLDMI